jgi:hypothetical protein
MSALTIQDFVNYATRISNLSRDELIRYGTIRQQQEMAEEKFLEYVDASCMVLPDPLSFSASMDDFAFIDDPAKATFAVCLNKGRLYYTKPNISQRLFAKHYFPQNLQQIGGESASGYAMLGNVYVVKSPRRVGPSGTSGTFQAEDPEKDLLHEFIVGIHLNILRGYFPTFTALLGYFKCSPPYLDEPLDRKMKKRQAITYCSSKTKRTSYLLYEKVENARTFLDLVSTISLADYLNVFLQYAFAFDFAGKTLDFSHNDFHYENALVESLTKPVTIAFPFQNRKYYMTTRKLGRVIDYGRSHVAFDGQHYGINMAWIGIFPDQSKTAEDLFHLLCFTLTQAFNGDFVLTPRGLSDEESMRRDPSINRGLYPLCQLLKLFGIEAEGYYFDFLAKIGAYYFALPRAIVTTTEVINFILETFAEEVSPFVSLNRPQGAVYGCIESQTCRTTLQIAHERKDREQGNGFESLSVFEWFLLTDEQLKEMILTRHRGRFLDAVDNEVKELMKEFKFLQAEEKKYGTMSGSVDEVSFRRYVNWVVATKTFFTDLDDLNTLYYALNYDRRGPASQAFSPKAVQSRQRLRASVTEKYRALVSELPAIMAQFNEQGRAQYESVPYLFD